MSCRIQAASRAFTTNQPSVTGARPVTTCSSRASSIPRTLPSAMTSFSLRQVKLRPGEQYRDEFEVELPAFEFGGQRYMPVPEQVPAAFEITRANTGTVFTPRVHRAPARALLPLPRRRRARGADHSREYQAERPRTTR